MNFGIFLAFFSSFALLLANSSLESMDEIWCYGFSNRLANGYIPYKDYNLIITPFFVVIGSFFAQSLLLFRIYGSLISAGILFVTYWICKKNRVNIYNTVLLTLVNGVFLLLIVPYANYNTLLMLFLMLSYLSAKKYIESPNHQSAFVFGLLLAISILIKQNIPILIFISFSTIVVYQVWVKTIKKSVAVLFAIGCLSPIMLFVAIAYIYDFLDEFLDYAVFGLNAFSTLSATSTESQILIVFCILITFVFSINFIKVKFNRNITFCTLIFSVSAYAIIFPIMDLYHTILLFIFQTALTSSLLVNSKDESKYIRLKIASTFFLLIMSTTVALPLLGIGKDGYVKSSIDPYRDVYIDSKLEKNIKEISQFILTNENNGYDVAIIDGSAYLYNLAADDYNGILDLLNIGNIGSSNNKEIISAINKKDIILVSKNYKWQDIIAFRDYVVSNYIQAGEVGNKTIYVNPKVEKISN